jgi:hypothetical protein
MHLKNMTKHLLLADTYCIRFLKNQISVMPAADFKHFDVSKILASVAQQTSQGTLKAGLHYSDCCSKLFKVHKDILYI